MSTKVTNIVNKSAAKISERSLNWIPALGISFAQHYYFQILQLTACLNATRSASMAS